MKFNVGDRVMTKGRETLKELSERDDRVICHHMGDELQSEEGTIIVREGYESGNIYLVTLDNTPFDKWWDEDALIKIDEYDWDEFKKTGYIPPSPKHDNINKPKHYNMGEIEPIDVIEDWRLDYHLGNAVKYIARCEYKENKINDLKKAIWYIEREIENEVRRQPEKES